MHIKEILSKVLSKPERVGKEDKPEEERVVPEDPFLNGLKRLRSLADEDTVRRTFAELPNLAQNASNQGVLGMHLLSHHGPDDAMYHVVMIRRDATPSMVGKAIGMGPNTIDRKTFERMESERWYLARTTQEYFQPPVTTISDKPINLELLLSDGSGSETQLLGDEDI
jgi:hypothetical protein